MRLSKSLTETGGGKDRRVRLVGHPFAPIGMGEHVRSVWRALHEAGVDAGIVDIYGMQRDPDPELVGEFAPHVTENLGDGVNVFCINGDEVDQTLGHLVHRNPMAQHSRNVIYPAWELERYPEPWARELMRFDEVWAPSRFIRDAIAKAVGTPVLHMPLACEVRRRALRSRRHFGIRESAYVFLFAFDFLSYVERKNPFAAIEAFTRFLKGRPYADVSLVIKTNNAEHRPEMKARFDAAIEPLRDHVTVIDGTLSELDMKALLWLCDCFLSLHRSEGFGRGLTEAMALGKPVIATAYSGNMDFCTDETAFLVPFELVPVREGDYPHWEGQHWADADVAVAAQLMKQLVDDPALGRAKGAKARERLIANFSYLAIGQTYAERLEQISTRQAATA
jgi:glycosyltransferase involved in cell wall biosynthesis